jgi:hypothetical protein
MELDCTHTSECYVDRYLQAAKLWSLVLFIFRVTYKSFIGEMYVKIGNYFMARISVSRPGTNRIPCEARDFIYTCMK